MHGFHLEYKLGKPSLILRSEKKKWTYSARRKHVVNFVECNGSVVELHTLDYENPVSNPVLRC